MSCLFNYNWIIIYLWKRSFSLFCSFWFFCNGSWI